MFNSRMASLALGLSCSMIPFLDAALPLQGSAPALLTPSSPSSTPQGDSNAAWLSSDGQSVFFLSTADNLGTNGRAQGVPQIFARDLFNDHLELVSANTNGLPGNGASGQFTASGDGRIIAFISEATDLVSGATNAYPDVYVRDRVAGTTRLLSHAPNGSRASGPSMWPVVTEDGRFVFFDSGATNLVAGITNLTFNLFRADVTTGELLLLGPASNLERAFPAAPRPSDTGNRVIFATDYSQRLLGMGSYLYFREINAATNVVLNQLLSLTLAHASIVPAFDLNGDGSVAIASVLQPDSTTTNTGLYRFALATGQAQALAPELNTSFRVNRGAPGKVFLSRDGERVAFEAVLQGLTNGPEAVYLWDAMTRTSTLVSTNVVSVTGSAEPLPFGVLAGMNSDARFVAWLGYATPLEPFPSASPLQLFVRDQLTSETRLITRTRSGAPSAQTTDWPDVSFCADGHRLAFQSSAADLVENDLNAAVDVFLYDWDADRLELMSRAATASATNPKLALADENSLSADGRYFVFTSTSAGTNDGVRAFPNIYLRDLTTGSNTLVSFAVDGSGQANSGSHQACISADGHWVAFASAASNLVPGDTNGVEDVFLYDVLLGKTAMLSGGVAASVPRLISQNPAINRDGSQVAFTSSTSGIPEAGQTVYMYSRASGTLQLIASSVSQTISRPVFSPDGAWLLYADSTAAKVYGWDVHAGALRTLINGRLISSRIAFSGDGTRALITVQPSDRHLILYDLVAGQATDLGIQFVGGGLDQTGNRVAVLENRVPATSFGGPSQVKVIDLKEGSTNLVSASSDNSDPGDGRSFLPLITPDGRFVVYASQASNLTPGASNRLSDLFVRDQLTGTTLLLSQSITGNQAGDAPSGGPILAQDGRTLVFTSFASNLTTNDFNQGSDLFVVHLPGPESDFRILTVTQLSTGDVTLIWASKPDVKYQVEFSDALGSAWHPLGQPIQAQGPQTSTTDKTAQGRLERFYRVLQLAP